MHFPVAAQHYKINYAPEMVAITTSIFVRAHSATPLLIGLWVKHLVSNLSHNDLQRKNNTKLEWLS
jgi:uncharacterized oligopeptide transporter (OPT) family protein